MNRPEVKLDGIWGGDASYPGKPSCTGIGSCQRYHKTEPRRRPQSGAGAEGGRFTGSTEESGPMKPGNSVEGKTLRTRKIQRAVSSLGAPISSLGRGKPWTRGDSDAVEEST